MKYTIEGNRLVLTLTLSAQGHISSTGKSMILATKALRLPDGTRIAVNVYKPVGQ